ncbi:unnamed protein product [Closterium sp. NIES-65]|nr:unnamed protein product [Closterium sp. NIES-65]
MYPMSAMFFIMTKPPNLPQLRLHPFVLQLFTHFFEQLDTAMYAEGRQVVVLLDNASSHTLTTEGAETEDLFGFRTRKLSNVRLVYLPPNTTCFTQPLDQGMIAMTKARGDPQVQAGGDIGLDEELNDVGVLIDRLGLGPSALPAAEFVGIDDNQPTCAEPGEDPLAREPASAQTAHMWEAPAAMQAVYDDNNPTTREARRTARAACEMLIGYARATCITPRDLCALFDIRNPMIIARMERASQALNLNATPPPAPTHEDTPPAETPRRRGRLLPAWMTVPTPDWVAQSARRQELIDAGAPAVMSGYLAAAEWMRL